MQPALSICWAFERGLFVVSRGCSCRRTVLQCKIDQDGCKVAGFVAYMLLSCRCTFDRCVVNWYRAQKAQALLARCRNDVVGRATQADRVSRCVSQDVTTTCNLDSFFAHAGFTISLRWPCKYKLHIRGESKVLSRVGGFASRSFHPRKHD